MSVESFCALATRLKSSAASWFLKVAKNTIFSVPHWRPVTLRCDETVFNGLKLVTFMVVLILIDYEDSM